MSETKNGVHLKDITPDSLIVEQDKYTDYSVNNRDFPIDIFPDSIRELIINANETVGYNKDFFSASILSACATAIGGSNKIDIKQYTASPILWIAIVGNSGDGKTHPIEEALRYFKDIDQAEYDNYKSLVKDWQSSEKNSQKPIYKSNVLKNFTIEALADKLQYNPNLLLYRDELMGWINSFNQYNKGSDQQEYLELFNGHGITVERKTSEPIKTKSSCINIIGGIQKKKLRSLSKNDRDADGFMERILFVFPDNVKPPKKTFKNQGDHYKERLFRTLESLSSINNQVYTLDVDCETIYGNWYNESVEIYGLCPIQAKLDTYLTRLVLIIDILHKKENKDTNTVIYSNSIHKAIQLVEYFRKTANNVKNILENGLNPLEELSLKYQKLYHDLEPEFKVNDEMDKFLFHKVTGGSIYDFLNKKKLFTKLEHGIWKKKI